MSAGFWWVGGYGEDMGGTVSGGGFPRHLTAHDGLIIASNYLDGTIGVINTANDVIQLVQPKPLPSAQPHAHSTMLLDATNLAILDLGTNSVHLYAVTGDTVERTGTTQLPVGTGPRDIARYDSGLLFILGELGGVLLAGRWDGASLELVASAALPGFEPGDHAASVAFHEEFVCVGLRGSNRVSVLRVSISGVSVEPVGAVSCEVDWPGHMWLRRACCTSPMRNPAISPVFDWATTACRA